MKPKEIRKKLEPWEVLISFFIIPALILGIQFKVEDIYQLKFTTEFNNTIFGIIMLLLVSFFFFYYKKKFKDLPSIFKFNLCYFLGGFLIQIIILLLSYIFPYLIITRDMSEVHFSINTLTLVSIKRMVVPLIIGPIIEEVFFRGILQRLFIEYYSLPFAIIFCGLSFAIIHLVKFPSETNLEFILRFFTQWFHGILLSSITYKTKNLSFAFSFHISNNFIAFLTS